MATYEITAPNGKKYRVSGQGSPEEAMKALQMQLGSQQQPEAPSTPERNLADVPGEALSNIGPSAWNAVTGIYDMVRHPVQTFRAMDDATTGAINNLEPEWLKTVDDYITPDWFKKATAPDPEQVQRQNEAAKQLGSALYDRYGTWNNIKNTMATDPVGSALDVASVLTGVGGVVRGGGNVISTGTRIPGMTRKAEKLLREAAPRSSQELANLGQDAMLLDASPSMTGLAQGVATSPTPARNAIVDALESRNQARTARLEADRLAAIGQGRDPNILKKQINDAASAQADPLYTAAKQNAPPPPGNVGVSQSIIGPAKGLAASERAVINSVMSEVDDALRAPTPQLAAERLHNIRKVLDKQIVWDNEAFQALSSADKATQNALRQARGSLDSILKNQYGFDVPDAIVEAAKNAQADIDFGFGSLEGGKYATTPEKFNAEFASKKRSPQFIREGMRADIRTAVGTQANDLPALRKKVGGDNDFNRAKLETAFGPDAVNKMVSAVKREETFARSHADITRNSQTAQRTESTKAVNASTAPKFTGSETMTGVGLSTAAKIANALIGKAGIRASEPTRQALVRALTAQGPEAVKILDQINSTSTTRKMANELIKALVTTHVSETINSSAR